MADVPQGGLNQATPQPAPPPQPPAFQSSPYGFNANPATLQAAADPTKIMSLLKSNLVDDEEIRRNKFFAGLGAPTRSGSIGESFSNALGGLADLEERQKQMVAQYAPAMMQHLMMLQQNMLRSQELNQKNIDTWDTGLNSRMTALLRSGTPVTPEALHGAIQMAGNELGVPAGYMDIYEQGLAGGAPAGADLTQRLQTRLLAGLPSEKQAGTIAPPQKLVDVGAAKVPSPEGGQAGLTPPQNMPTPLAMGAPPQKIEHTTNKFGGDVLLYKGIRADAGTPEAAALQQMFEADQAKAGTAPAPAGAPPPPPAVPPPGARVPASIGLPPPRPAAGPQGAPAAPQAPPMAPQPPGGMALPGNAPVTPQDRLSILNQELADPNITPDNKAALQREIALVTKQTGLPAAPQGAAPITQPTQVAPGVVATPKPQLDPGLNPVDVQKQPLAGANVQFTDIPQRAGLMDVSGNINPIAEKVQSEAADQFLKANTAHETVVSSMQETLRRMSIIQNITKQAMTGNTAGLREEVASTMADLGNMFGFSPEFVKSVTDGVAGGNRAAIQQFEKLAVSGAMVGLRADIGSSAGQRIAMQEFLLYQKAVPNAEMSPDAIARLRENVIRDYLRARTEQDARAAFTAAPNADYSQFGKYWADKQQKLGLVPQNVQVGVGVGSGLPFANIGFDRDPSGKIRAFKQDANGNPQQDKDGKPIKYYVNDKFLTSGW